ncbi:tetratricopeptide repeat protein [Candidatus Woesearchaeota archaeon]|nr:tetratricopeptide repeat protein [Candidatus Woesearchaeota archaeon]
MESIPLSQAFRPRGLEPIEHVVREEYPFYVGPHEDPAAVMHKGLLDGDPTVINYLKQKGLISDVDGFSGVSLGTNFAAQVHRDSRVVSTVDIPKYFQEETQHYSSSEPTETVVQPESHRPEEKSLERIQMETRLEQEFSKEPEQEKHDEAGRIEMLIQGELKKGHESRDAGDALPGDDPRKKMHYAESENAFRIAAELNYGRHDIGWTYQWIARACIHQDKPDEAIHFLHKAEESLKHKYHEGLQEAIDWTRNQIVDKEFFWGECNREKGDYAEAVRNYQTIMNLDPHRSNIGWAYYWASVSCSELRERRKASEYLQKAQERANSDYYLQKAIDSLRPKKDTADPLDAIVNFLKWFASD